MYQMPPARGKFNLFGIHVSLWTMNRTPFGNWEFLTGALLAGRVVVLVSIVVVKMLHVQKGGGENKAQLYQGNFKIVVINYQIIT